MRGLASGSRTLFRRPGKSSLNQEVYEEPRIFSGLVCQPIYLQFDDPGGLACRSPPCSTAARVAACSGHSQRDSARAGPVGSSEQRLQRNKNGVCGPRPARGARGIGQVGAMADPQTYGDGARRAPGRQSPKLRPDTRHHLSGRSRVAAGDMDGASKSRTARAEDGRRGSDFGAGGAGRERRRGGQETDARCGRESRMPQPDRRQRRMPPAGSAAATGRNRGLERCATATARGAARRAIDGRRPIAGGAQRAGAAAFAGRAREGRRQPAQPVRRTVKGRS